jgi:hypothetical protein
VDGGVVVGLCWGSIAVLANFIAATATGKSPLVDTQMPTPKR